MGREKTRLVRSMGLGEAELWERVPVTGGSPRTRGKTIQVTEEVLTAWEVNKCL